MAAKARKLMDEHTCRINCIKNITSEQLDQAFEGFWSLASWSAQNTYISGLVSQRIVSRRYSQKGNDSRRKFTRDYFLSVSTGTVKVCKTMFLATLDISNGRLSRALKSQLQTGNGTPIGDRRGKHTPLNKTPQSRIEQVRNHISSFPTYASHYSRKDNPSKRYLSPTLSISKMFKLYKEECEKKSINPVKEWCYRRVFVTDFHLSFHRPHSDTCKRCDAFKVKIEAIQSDDNKKVLKDQWELHKRKAENAQNHLKIDSQLQGSEIDTFTFDLQKTMPTPSLTTSVAYYKRQLWTYNLGVHSCSANDVFMYMWHEGQASRGSQEIGSCLMKYLKQKVAENKKVFFAYSDACGGQNRNINIALFWSYAVTKLGVNEINHKFMVSGHSYLPNDRDFGKVENAKKRHENVYTPQQWMKIVEEANRKKAFNVVPMKTEDFVGVSDYKKQIVIRKKDTAGNKVEWLKIQWIKLIQGSPNLIYYKYNLNDCAAWNRFGLNKRVGTWSTSNDIITCS